MTKLFIELQTNTLMLEEKTCFTLKRKTHSFSYTIVTNVLALEMNALKVNALKVNTLKASIPACAQHSYTCSYQQLSGRDSLEIVTHRHSPSKTGGSHAFVLTCEYATPTSYIRNGILRWTKRP